MVRAGRVAALTATLALLAIAPSASAQSELYNDFQGDGQINPCAYSPGQLQNGLNNLPPDLQQYAPGFADQLRAGLEAQCGGGAVPTPESDEAFVAPVAPGKPPTTTKIRTPDAPKPVKRALLGNAPAPDVAVAPTGSDPPDALLPLLAVGGLLMLLAIGGAARLSGLVGSGRVTGPLGASFADLGARTADALAYARDVVRFGR